MTAKCKLTYEYACSFCNAVHREVHCNALGLAIAVPFVPDNWVEIGGNLICPRHSVDVALKLEDARGSKSYTLLQRRARSLEPALDKEEGK